jgi:hypothetical protein
MLRLRTASTFLFPLLLAVAARAQAPAEAPAEAPDAHQVHWQRSLADARALAVATGRPLLVAINMDGESASDRTVREQYRDAAFVALTRRCVCVGGSLFRHNARDHDEDGRRIPCPRFGGITCGEHVALEPELFAAFLADGERVAPRHALVRADGTKAFDLSLSFDLKDVDRALAAATAGTAALEPPGVVGLDWPALASLRDARGRDALEAAVAAACDDAALVAALAAIGTRGDAGSADALRLAVARGARLSARAHAGLAAALRVLPQPDAFALVQQRLQQVRALPGDPGPDAGDERLAALLPPAANAEQASFVRARAALLGDDAAALDEHGDAIAVDLRALLQTAAAVTRAEATPPREGVVRDVPPPVGELEAALERLDAAPAEQRETAAWAYDLGKASLDLGRQRADAGQKGAGLLFEDAARYLERATTQQDDRPEWWIERARAAYFLGRFDEQAVCGARAFVLTAGAESLPADAQLAGSAVLQDARAVEALRWVGDAHARLLPARSGGDADVERAGMVEALRALGVVAASPFGRDADWATFASLCGALGLVREQVAVAWHGAMRFPASRDLRAALNGALWQAGRPDLMPLAAEAIARAHPPAADAAWFAGYAWVLAAEDERRRIAFPAAEAAYARAGAWYERAAALDARYADDCAQQRAIALVGTAFAEVDAGQRRRAAAHLAHAVDLHRDLTQLRDGLGHDVLDLVDKLVEWRADGPSEVDPATLLALLDAVAPGEPFWAAAVADAALREALRADGRNPDKRERTTVDAADKPITMAMGLPTTDGDALLAQSIEAGRRAAASAKTPDDKLPLAQSLVIRVERELERGREAQREPLAEAAASLGLEPPAAGADQAALRAFAAQLRVRLGEARPRFRPGR